MASNRQGQALYLDASAIVKLVVAEQESSVLADEVAAWPLRASSVVASVETRLAVERHGASGALDAARRVLSTVTLIALEREIVERAGRLAPLRALDAIHLASALVLGESLGAFVAYDRALAEAAAAAGLRVLTPA